MLKEKFDKYALYIQAVQSPETDVDFLIKTFHQLKARRARSLREDFCGTFALAHEWVQRSKEHWALALDLDPEALDWGKRNFYESMNASQRKRLQVLQKDVRSNLSKKVDLIVAFNFSYFLFKQREELKNYFESVHRGLLSGGIFVMDCFGGMACGEANQESTSHRKFRYFWEQKSFNPITHEARFAIHFQRKNERLRRNVFTYDWRMWSLPELREILGEVGFTTTSVFWEQSDPGSLKGNGIYRKTEKGEACEAWIAYVVAEK